MDDSKLLYFCIWLERGGSLPEGNLCVEDTCQVKETW